MKLEGRFGGDPYGAIHKEPAPAWPSASGYRASFIAHIRDEAHPPGTTLPDWMADPNDDDYLDKPYAGNPNILPGCANDEDFAAWLKSSTPANVLTDDKAIRTTSGLLLSPGGCPTLLSRAASPAPVPQPVTKLDDNLGFYNQGNYSASPGTVYDITKKGKPGKGKVGKVGKGKGGKGKDAKGDDGEGKGGSMKKEYPQRPLRSHSPNYPWEV